MSRKRYQTDAPNLVAALNELIGRGRQRMDIAESIGVHTDSISRYLGGSRSRIPFPVGWKIMCLLDRWKYAGPVPNLVAAIRELVRAGLTRAEIAEEIGVDTDSISRYLDGSRSRIPWVTGWAIMRMRERVCR